MNFLEKSYIGKNKWYLYLAVLFITFIACQLGGIPFAVYQIFAHPEVLEVAKVGAEIDNTALSTPSDNIGLGLMLLSFAIGLAAFFLFAKVIQNKTAVDVTTGRSKFDWGRFFFGVAIWGVLLIVVSAVEIGLDEDVVYSFDFSKFLPLLIVSLIMFPFQTAFEEVIFRGYLMQGTARLFRYRYVPLIITSVLFGLMHGANPEVDSYGMDVALPQYILMGLIMGYVAVKDGGIELAWGMHFINNLLSSLIVTADGEVFKTAAVFTDMTPTQTHMDTLAILVAGVVFIMVCNRKYQFFSNVSLWKKIEKPVQNQEPIVVYEEKETENL
ncbi:MAG: CPBP family intramembrane metalloprotease [Flavobacteriales bacterium]|nr:CPBP family intramembrane metalloprotease [Flavobacteriales bacterium]